MPVVLIPTAYRAPTRGMAEVKASGATIRACLESVEVQHHGFLELVVDLNGEQHPFVKLFVNQVQIEGDGLDFKVAPEDRIEVLAAIAGG